MQTAVWQNPKGLGNPEALARKLERIGNVLDKYDPTCIPDGAHVSMGIENEATQSIVDEDNKESAWKVGVLPLQASAI